MNLVAGVTINQFYDDVIARFKGKTTKISNSLTNYNYADHSNTVTPHNNTTYRTSNHTDRYNSPTHSNSTTPSYTSHQNGCTQINKPENRHAQGYNNSHGYQNYHIQGHNHSYSHYDYNYTTGGGHSDSSSAGYTINYTSYSTAHNDRASYVYSYYIPRHYNYGFDHTNYVPSTPMIWNQETEDGKALRDTVSFTIVSVDDNLHSNFPNTDADSKDIFFSVRMRKVMNLDGSAVSSSFQAIAPFNAVAFPASGTHSVMDVRGAAVQANNKGVYTFSLNTRNPFGKPSADWKQEEGYYDMEIVAWNVRKTGQGGAVAYYRSGVKTERFMIRQNFIPELSVINDTGDVGFSSDSYKVTFSHFGKKTSTPVFKSWMEDLWNNDYARANNMTDGVFVRFMMKDKDTGATTIANWQRGQAQLKTKAGVVLKTRDIFFSESLALGTNITQSNDVWKNGYAFFPHTDFPDGVAYDDCTVAITITDYLDAACTQSVGGTITSSVTFDIDTKVPVIADRTASAGNTSLVIPGAGNVNGVYEMKLQIEAKDDLTRTGFMTVLYAVTNSLTPPSVGSPEWKEIKTLLDSNGRYTIRGIKTNGTYYVHMLTKDMVNNETRTGPAFGPYTRFYEPELGGPDDSSTWPDDSLPAGVDDSPWEPDDGSWGAGGSSGSGVYIVDIKSAGKTQYPLRDIYLSRHLGYGIGSDSQKGIKQGYSVTLRVVSTGAAKFDLELKDRSGNLVPVYWQSGRVYKLDSPNLVNLALRPKVTKNMTTTKMTLTNDLIQPPRDEGGHIVYDTTNYYVAEYTFYIDKDILVDGNTQILQNIDELLTSNITITGQMTYPTSEDGHTAGQPVTSTITYRDIIKLVDVVQRDGGTPNRE